MEVEHQNNPVTDSKKQSAEQFIPPKPRPDPTHEAYVFDKATGKKTPIAQGSKAEIKFFVEQNRTPGKWLYMREIAKEAEDGNQSQEGQAVSQGPEDHPLREPVASQADPI